MAVAGLRLVGLDDGDEEQPAVSTGFKASGGKPPLTEEGRENRLTSNLQAPVEHSLASLRPA